MADSTELSDPLGVGSLSFGGVESVNESSESRSKLLFVVE
jgi:hypothetical protein